VGRNKKIRTRLSGLERSITKHQARIEAERAGDSPRPEVIKGWKAEIEGWEKERARLLRRLRRDW